MKKCCLILLILFVGINNAQAVSCQTNSDCQAPNDLCAPIHQGINPGNNPPKHCTNQAAEDAYINGRNYVPQLGGGQNNNDNNGNTNQGSQGPRPCPNPLLGAIAKAYAIRKEVPLKNKPDRIPTQTSGFAAGFAGFIRGVSSIVAGDEQKCTYIPKSPEGRALSACTDAAEADGTYLRYLIEKIAMNTPNPSVAARRRILIECMKTLGMTDIAAAEKAVSDVTQQCKK